MLIPSMITIDAVRIVLRKAFRIHRLTTFISGSFFRCPSLNLQVFAEEAPYRTSFARALWNIGRG